MILGAFEALYDRMPPKWLRKVEAAAVLGVFAEAFDVKPPETEDMRAEQVLFAFREFTAACMEAALADRAVAERYRARLGDSAFRLGARVRRMLNVRPSQAFRVTRFLYRGIGIELSGELPGAVCFGPCYFAERYTPDVCWFMAAFDEGFMRGITGCHSADLAFSCRLTEGAPCCRARFEIGNESQERPATHSEERNADA